MVSDPTNPKQIASSITHGEEGFGDSCHVRKT